MVEVPDSTTRYIENDSGKPTKDLFNWMRNTSSQLASIFSGTGGGLFSSGLPCFSVHKNTSAQGSLVNGNYTALTWSTELYDVGGHFASNTWVPPAGRVALQAHVLWTDASNLLTIGGTFACTIAKNSAPFRQGLTSAQIASQAACNVAMEDMCSGSDAYQVWTYQTFTGTTALINGDTLNTYFMGHWISP